MAFAEDALGLLTHRYLERAGAPAQPAVELLDRGVPLGRDLVPPRSRDAGPRPDRIRRAVDALLTYMSLVELVHQVDGASQLVWPRRPWCADALAETDLRRYYEHDRPQLLPIALRRRLEGVHVTVGRAGQGPTPLAVFSRFLLISEAADEGQLRRNADALVAIFRDGDAATGATFDHLLNAIVRAAGGAPARGRTARLTATLDGLSALLMFCESFDEFLSDVPDPALRSSFWHFHHHWFEELRDPLRWGLETVLDRLSTGSDEWPETHASAERLRPMVGRLFSGRYGWELRELLSSLPPARSYAAAGMPPGEARAVARDQMGTGSVFFRPDSVRLRDAVGAAAPTGVGRSMSGWNARIIPWPGNLARVRKR
jgi:hypothetical protein